MKLLIQLRATVLYEQRRMIHPGKTTSNTTRLPLVDWVARDLSGIEPLRLMMHFGIAFGLGLLAMDVACHIQVVSAELIATVLATALILLPATAGLIDSLFVDPLIRKFSGNMHLLTELVEVIKEFAVAFTTVVPTTPTPPPRYPLA